MANLMYRAFTLDYKQKVPRLRTSILLSSGGSVIQGDALWDTGASGTSISTDVAKKLNLAVTGQRVIFTPTGSRTVNCYMLDIILPNSICVKDVPVFESDIGLQNLDALIGMDIITLGDFCVSNFEDHTVLSFIMPPKKTTDFVPASNVANKISANGGGRRKKKR